MTAVRGGLHCPQQITVTVAQLLMLLIEMRVDATSTPAARAEPLAREAVLADCVQRWLLPAYDPPDAVAELFGPS